MGYTSRCFVSITSVVRILVMMLLFTSSVYAQPAQAEHRNQLSSPGIVINSKYPTARINVMKVHQDRLYVAGQDHVVRSYAFNENGDVEYDSCRTYRWPSWREERGEILAMDFSPDGKKMAIGGVGLKPGLVVEIELATGGISRSTSSVLDSVCALLYRPNNDLVIGTTFGEVVCWKSDSSVELFMPRKNAACFTCDLRELTTDVVGCFADGRIQSVMPKINGVRGKSVCNQTETIRSAIFFNAANAYLLAIQSSNGDSRLITYDTETSQSKIVWRSTNGEGWFFKNAYQDADLCVFTGSQFTSVEPADRASFVITVDKKLESKTLPRVPKTVGTAIALHSNILQLALVAENGVQIFSKSNPVPGNAIVNLDCQEDGSIVWSSGEKAHRFIVGRRELQSINPIDLPDKSNHPLRDGMFPSQAAFSRGTARIEVPLNLTSDRFATASTVPSKEDGILVVGHCFGCSLFDAKETKPQLKAKYIGHQDDVTSISFTTSRKQLVVGGRDGVISCFSLTPWQFHPSMGASFAVENGQFVVKEIDPGSPIWETGLNPGETVTAVYYNNNKLTPAQANDKINKNEFEIGKQWQFLTARLTDGVSTRVLQRPIWKFYERDGEWIWWRWRDYYYDCSTNGEKLIQWQVNQGFDKAPILINGDEARARFYRPEKLQETIKLSKLSPERVNAPELVPPKVSMKLEDRGNNIAITASLQPDQNALLVGEPKELSIWVNDHRIGRWEQPGIGQPKSINVSKEVLRSGNNRVIARAFNQIGIRGDSKSDKIFKDPDSAPPKLWGVTIGIKDYTASRKVSAGRGLRADNLQFTVRDAKAIRRLLERQKKVFEVRVESLIDEQATNESIFKQISEIAKQCSPNDWLVLTFAGHGYSWAQPKDSTKPDTFMLLTSKSSLVTEDSAARSSIPIGGINGGLQFGTLFDALASVSCRKLVLIDACHSGGALEMVKALTPDLVVGPTVITASQKSQRAQEIPTKTHGVFTVALLEAMTGKFESADKSKDGRLSSNELYDYCRERVPVIFNANKRFLLEEDVLLGQTPEYWAPDDDRNIPIFIRAQ